MKNKNNELRAEYDFSGGVRGKHHQAYRQGHDVKINKRDGSTEVHYFTPEDGSVKKEGDRRIVAQAQGQVQTFLDELKNGTRNYRTIASLNEQIAQEYRGRCILELLQNAHDALANAECNDPRQISFVLRTNPEPVLLIGNSGRPFLDEDFRGICQLGQSPKDPNESVGNKGLGFRSVLEVSTCPEIWSTPSTESNASFVFRFDPSVSNQVATAVQELGEKGIGVRSPFDPERPLVDWSKEQLNQYREHLVNSDIDRAKEAKDSLSPYSIPLPIEGTLPEVETLLSAEHVTVVRLPLDGGRTGTGVEEAVQSVKIQLQELDARSTIFLTHLEKLVIDIDGERRILERVVDLDDEFPGSRQTRRQRLMVGCSGPAPDSIETRQFHVWTRTLGGDDNPTQAKQIRDAVEHLPNRWPEVNQVTIGITVEDTPKQGKGVFVIFLPTDMTTGTGAHINAPFYGTLSRRQIDFDNPYNKLLLDNVLDLCLDATIELVSGQPEDWRAQAAIDLLSSIAPVGDKKWRFMDRLHERAAERDNALDDRALVLCDSGWCVPAEARMMPDIPDRSPINTERWREHAEFVVVSTALDGRRSAVKELITKFNGSPSPTSDEWCRTLNRVAKSVRNRKIDVSWDDFLKSVVAVLPEDLRSEPAHGSQDSLADAKFLPVQDGRLLRASDDSVELFFQPMQGIDDAANLVGEVPESLKSRVAFLHQDIQTHEGPQRSNTPVQKFLSDRFLQSFRREDLLRKVVVPAIPQLPISHNDPKAELCSDILKWTLTLVREGEPDSSLLSLLKRLLVACQGGWYAMSDAVFGPKWPGRLGDLVWKLADELPDDVAMRLRNKALLAPGDPRWRAAVDAVKNRDDLFARVGVVDGIRLQNAEVHFPMQGYGPRELPPDPPLDTPQEAWDAWRKSVEVKSEYQIRFEYSLSGIQLLPEIHYLTTLSQCGRNALSDLILASLKSWSTNWKSAKIEKLTGRPWSHCVMSPLKYWLKTLPWLVDKIAVDKIAVDRRLSERWLVPSSILRGQSGRFQHLDPLSIDLADRLEDEQELKTTLIKLGLNVYPVEKEKTGPELLEALATAWTAGKVPSQRFDVFLGQVRSAWQHLDLAKGLPEKFLVRTGPRTFSTYGRDDLVDVYLPDHPDRTRSLSEYGKPILEMPRHLTATTHVAKALLTVTDIRRASTLKERFFIDGARREGVVDGTSAIDKTRYEWLPTVLLTVAAHGGPQPSGAETKPWGEAANRFRRAHILECEDIVVELVDGNHIVASSDPAAQWLPDDNVLAVRRDLALSYESLAPATQAMLGRQDLLKDLRLVLGALADREKPTQEEIEKALERAEIDARDFADVRHRWVGNTIQLADRIRPVLVLLGISSDGIDTANTDQKRLKEWLSSNLPQWPVLEVLEVARRSRDDYEMGMATWQALGDVAQLPAWNEALVKLGKPYTPVENRSEDKQIEAHIEEAKPLLRGLARYIAIEAGNPDLFLKLEAVTQNFKGSDDWSTRWWEVPFKAVVDALHAGYAEVLGAGRDLDVIERAKNVDELHTAFQERGIETTPDPYETFSKNKKRFEEMFLCVHDLRQAWTEPRTPDSIASETPEPPTELDAVAYLHCWSEAELLERVFRILDDAEFIKACDGCTSLDEIRECLKLDLKAIEAQREERRRHKREAERKRRTFDVAGTPFEVGTSDYRQLPDRLSNLPVPEGPRASKDEFTPLANVRPSSGKTGGGLSKGKTSHLRPSSELSELVGIVGEIHAYHFLRKEFGNDIVTRDSWVSETRLKVLPLATGEQDTTSDSHGFDFQFRHHGKRWCIEVKATKGDEPRFDLGISEIKAANRLAQEQDERWRILRVRNTLSNQPAFDWLPNPFERDFTKQFRLHNSGITVSYTRKKT